MWSHFVFKNLGISLALVEFDTFNEFMGDTMTLKNALSLAIASLTLVAAFSAEAQMGYGRGPDRGGPGRGPDWGRDRGPGRGPDWGHGPGRPGPGPGRPYPPPAPPSYPQPPPPPPPPSYPPRVEQKMAYIGQRISNYAYRLRDLMAIDGRYNGYEVEQVMVDVRGVAPGTQIHLVINGSIQDISYNAIGQIVLRPRQGCILGRDIMNLDLGIQGTADIDRIYVNLRAPYYGR